MQRLRRINIWCPVKRCSGSCLKRLLELLCSDILCGIINFSFVLLLPLMQSTVERTSCHIHGIVFCGRYIINSLPYSIVLLCCFVLFLHIGGDSPDDHVYNTTISLQPISFGLDESCGGGLLPLGHHLFFLLDGILKSFLGLFQILFLFSFLVKFSLVSGDIFRVSTCILFLVKSIHDHFGLSSSLLLASVVSGGFIGNNLSGLFQDLGCSIGDIIAHILLPIYHYSRGAVEQQGHAQTFILHLLKLL